MPADTFGRFYVHPKIDGQKLYDTGEEDYSDQVLCEIQITGASHASISKPVYDDRGKLIVDHEGKTYPEKYPRAWADFNNLTMEIEGTPLKKLDIGPGEILNLKGKGVETIEELAELNDNVVIGVQGMLDLRKKAQAWLTAMNPEIQEAERKAQEEKEQAMQDKIDELTKMVADLKPKRGRPKK